MVPSELSHKSLPQKISDLNLWDANIDCDASVGEVEQLFVSDPQLPGCLILSGSEILGVLSQKRLFAALSRPYVRELYIKKPALLLMQLEIIDTTPALLADDVSIAEGVRVALQRDSAICYEPILVHSPQGVRILEVDLLMRAQSQLLQETILSKDSLLLEVQASAEELRNTMLNLEKARDRLLESEERLEAEVIKRTLELKTVNQDLILKQNQINDELQVARALQQSILPETFPQDHRYEGHAYMSAARMIGGDFYDVFKLDNDRLGVIVADVSGKGVPAALFMVLVRTMLQELAMQHLTPSACIDQANKQLNAKNPLSLFVTLLYGILDVHTGLFTFCNGGHVMPYVIRKKGVIETVSERGSPIVGLLDLAKFKDLSIKLEPGDKILMISDGVTECFNPEDEAFGEFRLLDFLKQNESDSLSNEIENLIETLGNFSNGIPASDDITALMVRFHGQADQDKNAVLLHAGMNSQSHHQSSPLKTLC